MTPFAWTRGGLLFAAVSLIVSLAREFLKWQDPAKAASEISPRLAAVIRGLFLQHISALNHH